MNVGILGAGQLSLLIAQANNDTNTTIVPFGVETCPELKNLASPVYVETFADKKALESFVSSVDVVTYETENIDINLIDSLNCHEKLVPKLEALNIFQNRLHEKNYLVKQQIGVANYKPVFKQEDLSVAASSVEFPAILKTNQDGYDGKGQVVVNNADELVKGWESLNHKQCVLEQMISFDQEISIVAARDCKKNVVFYPVSENFHKEGQLMLSLVTGGHPLQKQAESIAKTIIDNLDYIGCLAVEFFVKGNTLLVNEVAPRVHNSGHWTSDGSDVSQFLNHLKAVTNKSVLQPNIKYPSAMINFIGSIPDVTDVKDLVTYYVYDYGKAARPKRKLGHINIVGESLSNKDFFKMVVNMLERINQQSLADYILKRNIE